MCGYTDKRKGEKNQGGLNSLSCNKQYQETVESCIKKSTRKGGMISNCYTQNKQLCRYQYIFSNKQDLWECNSHQHFFKNKTKQQINFHKEIDKIAVAKERVRHNESANCRILSK